MPTLLKYFSFSLLLCSGSLMAQSGTVLTGELTFTDPELQADVLFIGGYHGVTNHKGELALARQDHDFTGYIPIDGRSDSGYVIVNHEQMIRDRLLGDGGGMTVFTVHRNPQSGRWYVVNDPRGSFRNVDFSPVGGTFYNCGGFQTAWGTVMTAEENVYRDNASIYRSGTGITDTSDYIVTSFNGQAVRDTIRRYQNFSWMVEVDVERARAIRKNYNMGRYGHEGGILLPDGKTVFLTDDVAGGFIYKFIAYQSYDLSRGQLYVYRQNDSGEGGTWLEMPMDLHSMIHAKKTASRLGATLFNRTEWAVYVNGKVYFTETGKDDTTDELAEPLRDGAKLARHLAALDAADGAADQRLHDYYGRILEMDMQTGHLRVYLEGGAGRTQHLANPDCLALTRVDGRPVVMISEDLNGHSHGRVPAGYNEKINEIFCLDLSIPDPSIDDLHKLAIGPEGCETTGGRFTPDGGTYFVNVQHPHTGNRFPFNNSVTVAVRNIDRWIARELFGQGTTYRPAEAGVQFDRTQERTLDRKQRYMVFNSNGDLVLEGKSNKISFYGLQRGRYQLVIDGRLEPLVIR